MVAELEADHLLRRGIVARRVERARLDKRDAVLAVHDVQRLALQPIGTLLPAVELEAAETSICRK